MEIVCGFSNSSRYAPFSPFTFQSNSESRGNYHHRCLSESFPIEEQPAWLDDLLNESEPVFQRGHRRSASDSFSDTFTSRQESKFASAKNGGARERSQNLDSSSTQTKIDEHSQDSEKVDEYNAQNLEAKPAGLKTDQKRAKQHNAHRSRVRKLQYIAHLERNVEILKAEGDGILAELEFFEQQNMILTMENRALRHRLETISQEQLIKHWEQGMLEKEIARLQSLHHLQKQQQMHQQQSYGQHPKHRKNRSADLNHQAHNYSIQA